MLCDETLVSPHLRETHQLLNFPPNRLFEPDLRTASAIRCRPSSTLPVRDFDPGLCTTPPSKPTEQAFTSVPALFSEIPLETNLFPLPRFRLGFLDESRLLARETEARWRANSWARASAKASVSSKRSSHSRCTVSFRKTICQRLRETSDTVCGPMQSEITKIPEAFIFPNLGFGVWFCVHTKKLVSRVCRTC